MWLCDRVVHGLNAGGSVQPRPRLALALASLSLSPPPRPRLAPMITMKITMRSNDDHTQAIHTP